LHLEANLPEKGQETYASPESGTKKPTKLLPDELIEADTAESVKSGFSPNKLSNSSDSVK
jgi:hypothetical protein